jgi:uncharacterized protein (DUF1778 family)
MATVSDDSKLEFQISADHKKLIEDAAQLSGQSVTSFAVSTLVEVARELLSGHQIIHLSGRDSDLFLKLLDEAPEPNERLRRAAAHYKENVNE